MESLRRKQSWKKQRRRRRWLLPIVVLLSSAFAKHNSTTTVLCLPCDEDEVDTVCCTATNRTRLTFEERQTIAQNLRR